MSPLNGDSDCCWRALSEEVIGGIKEWRLRHPKATLREIGAAVDQQPPRFRVCMLPATTFGLPVAGIFAASPVTAGWCDTPEGAPTPRSPGLAAVRLLSVDRPRLFPESSGGRATPGQDHGVAPAPFGGTFTWLFAGICGTVHC
jgi:hypothetical protein